MQAVALAGDLFEKMAAMLRVVHGPVEKRFDAHLDDGQRRLQFVGDVGDELLAQPFEPAQLGGVVQDEHGPARRQARQASGVDGETACAGAGPAELLALRFRTIEGALHHVQQRALADDLPQTPADGRLRGQAEQLGGAFVGVKDALGGVQRDNALDHAAEDGAQLLPVFFERGDAGVEPFAHAVEGPAQFVDLVVSCREDVLAAGTLAELVGHADQGVHGSAQASGQSPAEEPTAQHRDDGRAGNQTESAPANLDIRHGQGDNQGQPGEDGQEEEGERGEETAEHGCKRIIVN